MGAAETTRLGTIPDMSCLQLKADASLNAMADARLGPSDIDGIATAYEQPQELAHYLGIRPQWIDGTSVGGCSWMILVRHACAAIEAGLCKTVLVAHGESGRSQVGGPFYDFAPPGSITQQFDTPFGYAGAASMFTLPVVRYMREFGVSEEMLARLCVDQRAWATRNPRATLRNPTTVDEVLSSPMIAWPFRRAMCCLVSDGGGALILCAADRAADFPNRPVYGLGTGEAGETRLFGIAGVEDPLRPEFIRRSADLAFGAAGIARSDVDHLMIYDAFAHNPFYGLEGLGFVGYGEAGGFIADGNVGPGGVLPMNTNGGGLSYAHSGNYGMFAMQESIRQVRGTAAAQLPDVHFSVCHGWGGFFSTCATLIFSDTRDV
nr:thiolase [Sphingomonas sp. Y57]